MSWRSCLSLSVDRRIVFCKGEINHSESVQINRKFNVVFTLCGTRNSTTKALQIARDSDCGCSTLNAEGVQKA